jgi:hypothetical protein
VARTYLFWEPLSDNILQERDEAGVLVAVYTTEPTQYGNLINQDHSGVESHLHRDAAGSTLALTDPNQQLTDTAAYSAFGESTENTGITQCSYQYIGSKGYSHDAITRDVFVRRRHYDPTTIRPHDYKVAFRGPIPR